MRLRLRLASVVSSRGSSVMLDEVWLVYEALLGRLAVGNAGSLFASGVCVEGGWGEAVSLASFYACFGQLGMLLVVSWGTLVSVFL